jgi:hypothetical protein
MYYCRFIFFILETKPLAKLLKLQIFLILTTNQTCLQILFYEDIKFVEQSLWFSLNFNSFNVLVKMTKND